MDLKNPVPQLSMLIPSPAGSGPTRTSDCPFSSTLGPGKPLEWLTGVGDVGKVLKELFCLRRGTWRSSFCTRVASSGCASGLGYKAELAGDGDPSVLGSSIREQRLLATAT